MKDILNKFKILFYNPIIVYLLLIIGISLVAITSSAPLTEIQYGASYYAMRQGLFYGIGFILTFI
ncbi:MAG: FtsW/RodA/SpoVE family cell cycle protein, partial [Turicibacter sanguinis]